MLTKAKGLEFRTRLAGIVAFSRLHLRMHSWVSDDRGRSGATARMQEQGQDHLFGHGQHY